MKWIIPARTWMARRPTKVFAIAWFASALVGLGCDSEADNGGALEWVYVRESGVGTLEHFMARLDPAGGYLVGATLMGLSEGSGYSLLATDSWVGRVDVEGNLVWAQALGNGAGPDLAALDSTADGGLVAMTTNHDEQASLCFTKSDCKNCGTGTAKLVKLGPDHKNQWIADFPPTEDAFCRWGADVLSLGDSKILAVGNDTPARSFLPRRVWLSEVAPDGNPTWVAQYPNENADHLYPISTSRIGQEGFLVASFSTNGYNYDDEYVWLLRVDQQGLKIEEAEVVGDLGSRFAGGCPAPDGGFVVLYSVAGSGDSCQDIELRKVDTAGTLVWSSAWGLCPGRDHRPWDVIASYEGGYVVTGNVLNFETDRTSAFLTFFDEQGEFIATRRYPSPTDSVEDVIGTQDGGYFGIGGYRGGGDFEGDLMVFKVSK